MECRICLESHNQKNMIAPCKCNGTSQWVHRQCIEKWIVECDNVQAKIKCMECHEPYKYDIKGLSTLYKHFHQFKSFLNPLIMPISFVLIIITFVLAGDNQKLERTFLEIKILMLNIFYWSWIIILSLSELYSFYLSHQDKMLLNFIEESFSIRYSHFFFAIIINYIINCYWYISFGIVITHIYFLMNLDLIIFISKKNRKLKILKDLSKEDLELQELPSQDNNQ